MGLRTKWGTAILDGRYYRIKSRKEGNRNKLLHRLIWESVWGKIPEGHMIHHLDENPQNNCILNLIAVSPDEHRVFHPHTEEFKKRMSEQSGENHPFYGKHHSESSCKKMSIAKNSSGYYRVSKQKCDRCKNGVVYIYQYYDENHNRKSFSSVDLGKLEQIVVDNELEWIKLED